MTFTIRTRGDVNRPILCEFRCPVHGKFTALVASDDSDAAPCPAVRMIQPPLKILASFAQTMDVAPAICGMSSSWTPSVITMRVRRVEAVRGNHEKADHKGWLDTSNLEEGQDFSDWQTDREAVHEELRKDLVMEMVKSDR